MKGIIIVFMFVAIPSIWSIYFCKKVIRACLINAGSTLRKFSVESQPPYLKVQQVLRGSCPNGNMAMIGKYRRNVITLKENVR